MAASCLFREKQVVCSATRRMETVEMQFTNCAALPRLSPICYCAAAAGLFGFDSFPSLARLHVDNRASERARIATRFRQPVSGCSRLASWMSL